jgi:putative membrane protein insertion efficiency factor
MAHAQTFLRRFRGLWLGLAVAPIRFYKMFLSPILPPMCRFTPSCSMYTMEAIRRYGVLRGGALGAYRVLRCNPLSRGGHDPVP